METTKNEISAFEKWKYKRYLLLVVGVVMMTVIGIPYAWSVFNAPIAKEFLNVGQAELQFTFTVFMISYGVFGIVGGYMVGFFKTVKINLWIAAGAFLMFFPPQGYETPVRPARVDKYPLETLECTPGQMIKRPSFWLLYVMGTCSMMAGMGVISNARNLVLNVNPTLELTTVALVVGILSIGSACGRVFTGFLNDYCGTKTNIRVSAFCVFLSTFLVALAITTQSYVFIIVSFVCAGFATGMSVPSAAVVTRKLFGEKHYQVNFEIVMSCGIIHAFAATFVGVLYDLSGGYILPTFILAGLGLIGFVCSCLIRKP